jgi:DNA polymerase III epsilon subunit-like protein
MSYTTIEDLDKIINSKVLFYDLETIGLIKTRFHDVKPEEQYYLYNNNKIYDKGRVVQIGWLYMKEFDYDYEIKPENISSKIIKPDGFTIPEDVIKIHGITNEIANELGIDIKKVLNKLKKILLDTEYIIGYNVFFDVNILLNELNRLDMQDCIDHILKLKDKKRILCVGELSAKYSILNGWKRQGYRVPSQSKVYNELFKKEIDGIHNAKYDICASIEIMYWIYNNKTNIFNKPIVENKNGFSWSKYDENKLIKLYNDDKKSIDEIAEILKRTNGAIRSKLVKLGVVINNE